VRSLASGERSAPGEHSIRWDGRDGSGAFVRNGVYLVKVRAGHDVDTRKVVVLR
jgi:flagellar hook assembly protein FlgD